MAQVEIFRCEKCDIQPETDQIDKIIPSVVLQAFRRNLHQIKASNNWLPILNYLATLSFPHERVERLWSLPHCRTFPGNKNPTKVKLATHHALPQMCCSCSEEASANGTDDKNEMYSELLKCATFSIGCLACDGQNDRAKESSFGEHKIALKMMPTSSIRELHQRNYSKHHI